MCVDTSKDIAGVGTSADVTPHANVFGAVRMGYVVVESQHIQEWAKFGTEGIGMHLDRLGADALAFRLDSHQRRLIVRQGLAEDVMAIGWQIDDQASLDVILSRLRVMNIPVLEGSKSEAQLRGVDQFWYLDGPKHQTIELYVQPILDDRFLKMQASGFVTGASGMGHVAITTREPQAFLAFWQQVFDARISDHIQDRLSGIDLDFTFLRLNERHHSVAIASTRGLRMNPVRTKIHHMNLQAASLDDVTTAYLRCRKLGYSIANSIGQHPNDKELSFYVVTPSGFEIELGWDPILVHDEDAWKPTTYQGISLWGHFPENLTLPTKLGRIGRSLKSLAQAEFVPNAGAKP
ncbi:MAG: VOC family protein [Undibacterium sp.]|uniref:VOC family protein n=1 Tax=Undibacterium sp. TaxID=1914977 RepID=UPI00272152AF|nr:VOC family protein [Undibacterium sp.]MDO8650925.1 VOC family protein [Undibacterium sp.]